MSPSMSLQPAGQYTLKHTVRGGQGSLPPHPIPFEHPLCSPSRQGCTPKALGQAQPRNPGDGRGQNQGLMGLAAMPGWGTSKQGPLAAPGHSPNMLLGVVGASNQAGDQVCKAGTPQGEGHPPGPPPPTTAPTSALGHPEMAPWFLQPLAPSLWLCPILGSQLIWGSGVLRGVLRVSSVHPQPGRTWTPPWGQQGAPSTPAMPPAVG